MIVDQCPVKVIKNLIFVPWGNARWKNLLIRTLKGTWHVQKSYCQSILRKHHKLHSLMKKTHLMWSNSIRSEENEENRGAKGKIILRNWSLSHENTDFFISNTFINNARQKLARNQAKAKLHPEAELLLFENFLRSSCTLSSENKRRYSKNVKKTSASV